MNNENKVIWQTLTQNQKEVFKRILAGNYEFMKGADWGFLDEFIIFLREIGFIDVLDIKGEGYERRMVEISQLLMTYNAKILLGITSMNQVPDMLFKDIGLLMVLGYTARQIKKGICQRSKKRGKEKQGPMCKDTLADALERFSTVEIEKVLNDSVKILNTQEFIRDEIYIIDATDIETTDKCTGCGRRTTEKKKTDKKTGVEITEYETKYGFKLLAIRGVDSGVVVAAKIMEIQESANKYTLELIKQAEKNTGDKIKILLLDRGFVDGKILWTIKHDYGIDFVIPAKTTMHVSRDARGCRDSRFGEGYQWTEETKEIRVTGLKGLISYDQYGDDEHNNKPQNSKDFEANPINAIMVTKWNGKEYKPGKEKVFLTSLRVDKPLSVLSKYDLRSLIENTTFKELKSGWLIENIPKKTKQAVITHVFLTVCMYNMCKIYRSKLGKEIAENGIRKFRTRTFSMTKNKIVVISEPYYAVFDLEEMAILWGKPPKYFISINPKKFREEYGLTENEPEDKKL